MGTCSLKFLTKMQSQTGTLRILTKAGCAIEECMSSLAPTEFEKGVSDDEDGQTEVGVLD